MNRRNLYEIKALYQNNEVNGNLKIHINGRNIRQNRLFTALEQNVVLPKLGIMNLTCP